ncbi:MAG: hypothetical protein VXW58_07125, partial [Pseudomonadota bacterium]|nr:hypothetical protein [Pseudomonadota bacterium]
IGNVDAVGKRLPWQVAEKLYGGFSPWVVKKQNLVIFYGMLATDRHTLAHPGHNRQWCRTKAAKVKAKRKGTRGGR